MNRVQNQTKTPLSDSLPWALTLATVVAIGILPEYLALFSILIAFPVFKIYFSRNKEKMRMGLAGKAMLATCGYMLISALWSKTASFSLLIALMWLGMFLCMVLVANIVNSEERLNKILYITVVVAGIVGLIGILQIGFKYIGIKFPNPFWNFVTEKVIDVLPLNIPYKKFPARAASTFDNPLILTTYLLVTTPIGIHLTFTLKEKKKKIIAAVSTAFMLGGLALTFSRGGYIALAAAIAVFAFEGKKVALKVIPALGGIGAIGGIFVYTRYLVNIKDMTKSNVNRMKIWEACGKIFNQKPVFGHGAGNQNVMNLMKNEFGLNHPHAHNLFLELMCEIGIVGIILFFIAIFLSAKSLFEVYKSGGKWRKLAVTLASSAVGFLVMSFTEHTLQSPRELMLFMTFFGLIEAVRRLHKKEVFEKVK